MKPRERSNNTSAPSSSAKHGLAPTTPTRSSAATISLTAYQAAGRIAEAIELLEATLKRQESKLGPDHPDTLISRTNLAIAYQAAGRIADAIKMDEATLKQRESKLGPDHPDTLTSRNNLAEAYQGRRPQRRGHQAARGDPQADASRASAPTIPTR